GRARGGGRNAAARPYGRVLRRYPDQEPSPARATRRDAPESGQSEDRGCADPPRGPTPSGHRPGGPSPDPAPGRDAENTPWCMPSRPGNAPPIPEPDRATPFRPGRPEWSPGEPQPVRVPPLPRPEPHNGRCGPHPRDPRVCRPGRLDSTQDPAPGREGSPRRVGLCRPNRPEVRDRW